MSELTIEQLDEVESLLNGLSTPQNVMLNVVAQLKATMQREAKLREALTELVFLKDSKFSAIGGDEYYERKPLAWDAARKALKSSEY